MDKHEYKARVESQMDEWKRKLDVMGAKAEAAGGDAKVKYTERVAGLQKQYDDLKIKSARIWDVADDKWEEASESFEGTWGEWTDRAGKAWDELRD